MRWENMNKDLNNKLCASGRSSQNLRLRHILWVRTSKENEVLGQE